MPELLSKTFSSVDVRQPRKQIRFTEKMRFLVIIATPILREVHLIASVAALILLCNAATPLHAQSSALDGQVEGVITDFAGDVVPHIALTLTNTANGTTRYSETDGKGIYRFPLLQPGTYRVSIFAAGFKGLVREGITVASGQSTTIDLRLEQGELNETVLVSAESRVADAGKTDLSSLMNNREVRNVPLLSRNPYEFGRLTTNVNGRPSRGFGFPVFNANGLLRRVNYQIDGNVNTEGRRGTVRAMLISESYVSEVQLITNSMAAEFGNTAGMIMNVVTPSGGNNLNGSAVFRFQVPSFYSRPFFFPAAKLPDSSSVDLTTSLGGPIIRDRWQYYVGFEHLRYADNANSERLVVIRREDRDKLVEAGLPASIFPSVIPSSGNATYFLFRNDVQLNGNSRLALRYNQNDATVRNFGSAKLNTLEIALDNFTRDRTIALQLASYNSELLNEMRFQYTERTAGTERNRDSGSGPNVLITGVASFGSPATSGRSVPTPRIVQFQDNFSQTSGEHSFKVGGGLATYGWAESNPQFARYVFPTIDAYLEARSGVNPFGYSRYDETFGESGKRFRATFLHAFVQDDWKISRRLKVNLGLRYDLYLVPRADPLSEPPASRHFNIDTDNFAVRIGSAYAVREGRLPTILRIGAGLYFDAPILEMYSRAIQSNGRADFRTLSFTPASPSRPAFPNTFSGTLPPGAVLPIQDVDAVAADLETMYALNTSIQLEQAITEHLSASIGYVHSGGLHIPVYRNVNCLPIGSTLADGRPLFGPATLPFDPCTNRIHPQFKNVQMAEAAGTSRYDALNIQVARRFSGGVQFRAYYTLSRAVDDAPEQNLVNAPNNLGYILSDPSDRRRDHGYSLADQRHTFGMSLIALPTFSLKNSVLNRILNGNQLSIVSYINSGERFNIISGIDLNRDGYLNGDRPVGVQRNSGKTPPQFSLDLRYARRVRIAEGLSIEAFSEFQNLFNVNSIIAFQNISVPTDPITGKIIGGLPDFKSRNQSASLDSRQVQFGIRMLF